MTIELFFSSLIISAFFVATFGLVMLGVYSLFRHMR